MAAARTPYEAVRAFVRPLQLTLSCVTRASLDIRGGYYPGPDHPLTLPGAESVRLAGNARLSLAVEMRYSISEDAAATTDARWSVEPSLYIYTLYDAGNAMLLAYHWHPQGRSPIVTPHLHLGPGSRATDLLTAAHLPTGAVTLIDVVRLSVREFGVRPLRPDWINVLGRAEDLLGRVPDR